MTSGEQRISLLTTAVALLALGLIVAAVLVRYPPTGSLPLGFALEVAFAAVPVVGLVVVSRAGLQRRIVQLLFLGLFLLAVHAIADVLEELVLMPALARLALEELALVFGTALLVAGLYLWAAERRERERLLRERERRLTTTNEQLEVLTRMVRHDIENDMTVAIGWAELLRDHVDDAGRDPLRRVIRACNQVLEMTTSTRQLIRLVTESGRIETHPVDVAAVVTDEVEKASARYETATIETTPSTPTTGVEVAANEMLHSAVRNLLTNAVQHNDTDQPTVTVDLSVDDVGAADGNAETDADTEPDGDRHADTDTDTDADGGGAAEGWVRLTVTDDGPGVPDDRKELIFGKGEQGLDSEGTGIGLFLVRTLVEGFGGAVHVEDASPRGARFVVELPVRGSA